MASAGKETRKLGVLSEVIRSPTEILFVEDGTGVSLSANNSTYPGRTDAVGLYVTTNGSEISPIGMPVVAL